MSGSTGTKIEKDIQLAYSRFVDRTNDVGLRARVNAHLAAGDIERALDIIDEALSLFSVDVTDIAQTAIRDEASTLSKLIGALILVDLIAPRSASLVRNNRADFMHRVRQGQRSSTRAAVTRSFGSGSSLRDAFWSSVGLSSRFSDALDRYQRSLEMQGVGKKEKGRLTSAYRRVLMKYRTEQLARSAATRLRSEAQALAVDQAIEDGLVDPTHVVRVWNRIPDDRVRDAHDSMQGQEAALDEVFVDGLGNDLRYPGDPSAPVETTANCRCSLSVKIK